MSRKVNTEALFKGIIGNEKDSRISPKDRDENVESEKLIQKAYYLRAEQYKKLRILSAETEEDMSSIIRKALDNYFKENVK